MNKKIIYIAIVLLSMLAFSVVSAKNYKCETIDGAYYGKDGKEVDKVQYEQECVSHSCEIVGDTYYGKDGKEVSENTFENECNTTVVSELPDTASTSKILYIISGIICVLGTIIFSITYRIISDRG